MLSLVSYVPSLTLGATIWKISRAQGTAMIDLKGPRVAGSLLEEEVSSDNTHVYAVV